MRSVPQSAAAFLNQDVVNAMTEEGEPPRRPSARERWIGSREIPLEVLGRLNAPVRIYPFEEHETITEDDLRILEWKVYALVCYGSLKIKDARIIIRLLGGEKLQTIASVSGISRKRIVKVVERAIPLLQRCLQNEYFS